VGQNTSSTAGSGSLSLDSPKRFALQATALASALSPPPASCLPPKKSPPHHDWCGRLSEVRAGSSYFFVLSTLLPMMPPRIAPAAPPMIAPFTLFLLVTAPITAPAPAPIAASRLVCLTTTGAGAGAL
jgi:hypothetical protein